MIEPVEKGSTSQKARVVCDACATSEVFTSDYERVSTRNWKPNEGQVIRKAQGKGWVRIKGQLFCQKCNLERRMQKQVLTDVVTPIRQPTREQRRQMMELLTDTYDVDAGRYRGHDTDLTIAEVIGSGCMPGWVAEVRETFFGPDGGNDEIETIISDLKAWQDDMQKSADAMHLLLTKTTADLRAFNDGRGKAADFLARIEAVKKAVGPKAARA